MLNNRRYLAALAIMGLILVALLALVAVDRTMRASAVAQARDTAEGNAAILAAGLESELDKFTLVPRVLAIDPEVRALLAGGQRQRPILNRRLETLADQTGAAAIYLMDKDGLTLAASNWQSPASFVGSNYGFRSYFTQALTLGQANEFALGTVSRRPGLYIAQRVGDENAPLGVVALKVEFDAMEQSWRDANERAFVTDTDGVVLITSDPDWRFRTTGQATETRRIPAQDKLRFGIDTLEPMPRNTQSSAQSFVPLIEKIQPISPDGWELHLLADPTPGVRAAVANGRLIVLLCFLFAVGLCAGLLVWLRRREMHAEAESAKQTATLRDQLQQANRLATLGQVTAGVGHEIRQPVAAMRVYAETGQKLIAAGDNQAATENFGKIVSLTARIGEITEELLGFGRRAAHPVRQIPLAQAINGALLLLRDRIAREGVNLQRPDPELAQTTVRATSVRLEQVLINLLQNALDATSPGGTVRMEIEIDPQYCHLLVADSGPGIATEIADTIFQPFATTKEEGIGLGLAISFDIMRNMGGDLLCDSGPDGARFTMVIPRS